MENNNQLQRSNLAPANFDEVARMSKLFYDSKLFSDLASASQAGVKIMAGAELGISPFQSISGVHIIKGKPVIGAGLMASMLDSHPEYDFEVLEQSETVCSIKFFKNGKTRGTSTFTVEQAQKAGTQNLGKFPANMLYARAMSNGVKWYAPGLFSGPVYVPEEMQQEETVETTYTEVKVPEQPMKPVEEAQEAEVIQDAPQEVKTISDKQKQLLSNLLNSHHISEEYRQTVLNIETDYEGQIPVSVFDTLYQEVTAAIAEGTEKEKTTAATEEQVEQIGKLLWNETLTEKERESGFNKLQKGYSIAQANNAIKKLQEVTKEREEALSNG